MILNFCRPLWIDSLYGSNNTNVPSIYGDSCSRIDGSTVTTTNMCHFPTMPYPSPVITQKSNNQMNEILKYALTDVILQRSSLQGTCVSDSKLCQKREQQTAANVYQGKNFIRRVHSDFNVLLMDNDSLKANMTELSSINDNRLNKKSKSMENNIHIVPSISNQENISIKEKSEQIIENKSV